MYFHPQDHIYPTYFNKKIIVLDLKKNQYLFLSESLSEILGFALKNKFKKNTKNQYNCKNKKPNDFDEGLLYLQKNNFLSRKLFKDSSPKKIGEKKTQSGAHNIDWNIDPKKFN